MSDNTILVSTNLTTNSRIIADTFGKRHDDVLKRITNLGAPADFNARKFAVVKYVDTKGEMRQSGWMCRE